jgi:hypothetical protein
LQAALRATCVNRACAAAEQRGQWAVDRGEVLAEILDSQGQPLAGHLDDGTFGRGAGAQKHRDADHALTADGGDLHDQVGVHIGDDGHHTDKRKVHLQNGVSRLVDHISRAQRRHPQVGQERGEGVLAQAGQDGVAARGIRVDRHGATPPVPRFGVP